MTDKYDAKRIYTIPVKRTQCSWVVQGYNREHALNDSERRYLKAKGMDFRLCPKWSTHVIDNNHYCSQHAGVIALKLLTEDHTP